MVDSNIQKILNGELGAAYSAAEHMTPQQKYECILKLLEICEEREDSRETLDKVADYITYMVPHISSDKRFVCISRVILHFFDSGKAYGKEVFNVLDFSVVKSLQPLELLSLANMLSEKMDKNDNLLREAAVWGLIRIIPYMHSVNQKEYAHDVFYLYKDPQVRQRVLDALAALIYSMDQENRTGMIFFFADILKKEEYMDAKLFTLDLLARVTPALPEEERVLLADTVIPNVFFNDSYLVKRSVCYFSEVIHLLPASERFHYTQMIAGLINDLSVKDEVAQTLEKALPFLSNDDEKLHIRELMIQHQDDEISLNADPDYFEAIFDCEEVY